MYNHQLDAFVRVAKLGSFNKAAAAFYVTPSALIQQINHLEKELGAQLFVRTKKGVTLTRAGEYLYEEAQAFIEKSREIREQVKKLQDEGQSRIRVGTNLLHKMRLLGPLWQRFRAEQPTCELEIADTTGRYKTVDAQLVECVRDGEPWQRGMEFLQLTQVPVCVAIPSEHPAAQKKRLTLSDLHGETVVTIKRRMSPVLDRLADDLRKAGARVLEVDAYDLSVFSMCEVNGYFLQIPSCWGDLYSGMKAVPCEWDYALPYGFFYKPEPAGMLRAFIEFAEKQRKG